MKVKPGDKRLIKGRQEGIRGRSFLRSPTRVAAFYSRISAIRRGQDKPKLAAPLEEIQQDYSEI